MHVGNARRGRSGGGGPVILHKCKVIEELASLIAVISGTKDVPRALSAQVMDTPSLNEEHVDQLRQLADYMELCIRVRDEWRGQ